MRKKLSISNKSLLKGVERAKKLKDLEIAKSLEINSINKQSSNHIKTTPEARSDLPKE